MNTPVVAAALADFLRFIAFQKLRRDIANNFRTYISIGLGITLIVGIGRIWDTTPAALWLFEGLGSLIYALALSAFIWAVVAALKPARWSFRNVLLMVTMTALPGVIYALPVERAMSIETAQAANMFFLLIVATWRMALYYRFLGETAQLPRGARLVALLLPPTIILSVLSYFGIMQAIARGMAGLNDDVPAGAISDGAILALAAVSWIALPILLLAFVALVIQRHRRP